MTTADLPDPAGLEPIETRFWTPDGAVPVEADAVIRGSPITAAKFQEHSMRQARKHSYQGANMFSISVDLVLPDWPVERILRDPLSTYPRWARCPVRALLDAGFVLLATNRRPHADIVFPAPDILWAETLERLFKPTEASNDLRRR